MQVQGSHRVVCPPSPPLLPPRVVPQLYRQGTFDEALARLYCAEIVLAIAHLHSLGFVHRWGAGRGQPAGLGRDHVHSLQATVPLASACFCAPRSAGAVCVWTGRTCLALKRAQTVHQQACSAACACPARLTLPSGLPAGT